MTRLDALMLFALGLSLRLPLILAYPGIHGGDSVLRLARSDTLILGPWLPLPQVVVFVTRALAPDPLWTRLVFAVSGSLAAVALAWVVTATAGRASGRAAGVLCALHPLLVYYSLVPYQESPMLLLLLAGAGALVRGKDEVAGGALGLACLCRYEAWIAAVLAILARWRRPLRGIALFGWAPLAWVAAWHGLAPAGSYVFDIDPAAARLSRLPFLFAKLREYSGDWLLLLALAGAIVAAWRRPRRWAWGAAFLFVFLAAELVVGHEHPAGSGRLNERAAHVPAVALCALAGLALGGLSERRTRGGAPWGAAVAAAVLAAMGLHWAHRAEALVIEANLDPSLRLAVDVVAFAEERLPAGGRLAVAAPPVAPEAVEAYVRKVEAAGGEMARARALGLELAAHSPDLDRIAAHLPRPPGTAIRAGSGAASLVAVFDDAPDAASWRGPTALRHFAAGNRAVTVYASVPGRWLVVSHRAPFNGANETAPCPLFARLRYPLGQGGGEVSQPESRDPLSTGATHPQHQEWLEEFEAAGRRSLETRFRYAFIKTYKPVLDDAPYRAFETMADYRRWCEETLPDWLGYGRL